MGANLIEQLRQVEDFRTLDGRRHPRSVGITVCNNGHYEWICWVSCMGGFRQTASSGIDETFGIQKHGVPSYSTIRRVTMGVD